MTAPGWHGILDEGEQILWQGKPRGGIVWSRLIDIQTVFGIVFTSFAIFWVGMASEMTSTSRNIPALFKFFPLFGLIFVGVGLQMVIGRHLWDAYVRRGTHYTLTSKAAYIATQPLGRRKLQRFGFDEMTALTLDDAIPGSVHFAQKSVTYSRRRSGSIGTGHRTTTVNHPIGFDRIDDARVVYRMLRDARAAP